MTEPPVGLGQNFIVTKRMNVEEPIGTSASLVLRYNYFQCGTIGDADTLYFWCVGRIDLIDRRPRPQWRSFAICFAQFD